MSFGACQYLVGESCSEVLAIEVLALIVERIGSFAEIPLIGVADAGACQVRFSFQRGIEPMPVGAEELHGGIISRTKT
jgi:hypothetical protein